MNTFYLQSSKSICSMVLLSLGTILLSSCGRSHQLGVNANPQDILATKLDDPHYELSPAESISLIEHCARLSGGSAAHANGKEVTLVLGNTGAGKSTFLNCLMGCEMKLVKPSELNIAGTKKVVVVAPDSARSEVMPIGHGERSQTFMPHIVSDPVSAHRVYCDCPGFLDNRGAEINIANALGTRGVVQQARGVKVVFLASYSSLFAGRGQLMQAMANICLQMFGDESNLRRHENAVLFGITKAPLYSGSGRPTSLGVIRSRIIEENTPIARILANRIFLYDPLDRGRDNPDFWSIERCRAEIAQLSSIPQREATTLFQTVFTGEDQTKLKQIMRAQVSALLESLERDDYQAAEGYWQSLKQLRIIGSDEVEQMLREYALEPLRNFVLRRVMAYQKNALVYNFDEAERQLEVLRRLLGHFPNEQLAYSIEGLEAVLQSSREKRRIEEESIRENLEKAQQKAARIEREKAEKMLKAKVREIESSCCIIL